MSAISLKRALRRATPPAVLRAIRNRLIGSRPTGASPEWEYVPGGWPAVDADPRIKGWDHASVVETQRRHWPVWKSAMAAPQPVGCAYESPERGNHLLRPHNANLVLAYAALIAAGRRDALSLLDWGSGPGHTVEILRALAPSLRLDYHGRDLPGLVALGRELVPQAQFHDDDGCLARRYDLVVASSSLSYERDWAARVRSLAGVTDGYLLITRQPLTTESASYVFVQRAYAFGYQTEYAGWCIRRDDLVATAAGAGLALEREFLISDVQRIDGAPGACRFGGFLFRGG